MSRGLERIAEGLESKSTWLVRVGINEHLAERPQIHHLDDVTSENTLDAFSSAFHFKERNPEEFKDRLIELGIYSLDLRSYTPLEQRRIQESAIAKVTEHSRTPSRYFQKKSDVRERNRDIFAQGDIFMRYLEERNIYTLDDLTKSHATQPLGNLLGFKRQNVREMQAILVKRGTFSLDLSTYDQHEREHIARNALDGNSCAYLLPKHLANITEAADYLRERNRSMLIGTHAFLSDITSRWETLDDIEGKNTPRNQILGVRDGNSLGVQEQLKKHGVYSQRIADYDPALQEKIAQGLIDHTSNNWKSAYFTNVSDEIRRENQDTIRHTQTFQNLRHEYQEDSVNTEPKLRNIHRKMGQVFSPNR